jgi:uncharacterized protein (TIGR00725 family)
LIDKRGRLLFNGAKMKKDDTKQFLKQTQVYIPQLKTNWHLDRVAFFGSADITDEDELYRQAFDCAQVLAQNGKIIVNGGGPGIMQASTEGAESVGGKTIGVTLHPRENDMPEFEGQTVANHLTLEIKSRNYIERMFGLMTQADVFVCFRGGTGTLSEWATAWLLAHLYYGNHKPIVLYGNFWFEVMDVINSHFMIGEKERNVYRIVENKAQLLAVIEGLEREYQVLLEVKQTE